MCTRSRSFVLLVWLVGVLHARRSERFCLPPSLNHGYVSGYQSIFPHDTDLTYACDHGHKPAVEGWWARVTCQNGKWSHEPKCIDEKACLPPTIPNAGYVQNADGLFVQGTDLTITCDKGYEHKGPDTSVRCVDGSWTSVPVCEERADACGAPPKVRHAVIIDEEYQVVFAANSRLQYQCEDGYHTEDGDTKKTIRCEAGNWTRGPTCTRPSTDSGTNDGGTERLFTTIDRCGKIPVIQNGVVSQTERSYFKYDCAVYYKRVGADTVMCHTDGSWSQQPTCKASYCSVNTELKPELVNVGKSYIEVGKTLRLECVTGYWEQSRYADFHCTDQNLQATKCCTQYSHDWNYC